MAAYGGRVMARADKITPAGIRQAFLIHTAKTDAMAKKSDEGLDLRSYGRGPQKRWLQTRGRSEHDKCECGEIQNAVHLLR